MTSVARVLEHPWSLLLLAVLPMLTVLSGVAHVRARHLLARIGNRPDGRSLSWSQRLLKPLLELLAALVLVGMVLGIAGPRWGTDGTQTISVGRDVVVVLDLSRSMLAQDVLPDRLGRARAAIEDLSRSIEQHGGHRVALIVFAAKGSVVCPLTTDYDHFRHALAAADPLQIPGISPVGDEAVSGTRIGAGLIAALAACEGRQPGFQDVLLLSDGDDPAGDEEWRQGGLTALSQSIPVHTIGIGDPERDSPIPLRPDALLRHDSAVVQTRLKETPLRELARMTGGVYVPARTDRVPLGKVFTEIIEPKRKLAADRDLLTLPRQQYFWFFGAALFMVSLDLMLGLIPMGGTSRSRKVGPSK